MAGAAASRDSWRQATSLARQWRWCRTAPLVDREFAERLEQRLRLVLETLDADTEAEASSDDDFVAIAARLLAEDGHDPISPVLADLAGESRRAEAAVDALIFCARRADARALPGLLETADDATRTRLLRVASECGTPWLPTIASPDTAAQWAESAQTELLYWLARTDTVDDATLRTFANAVFAGRSGARRPLALLAPFLLGVLLRRRHDIGRILHDLLADRRAAEPGYAALARIAALTGAPAHRDLLAEYARQDPASGWISLALWGRRAAAPLLLDALAEDDAVIPRAAWQLLTGQQLPASTTAAGNGPDASAIFDAAQQWWAEHEPGWTDDGRYLFGQSMSPTHLSTVLSLWAGSACQPMRDLHVILAGTRPGRFETRDTSQRTAPPTSAAQHATHSARGHGTPATGVLVSHVALCCAVGDRPKDLWRAIHNRESAIIDAQAPGSGRDANDRLASIPDLALLAPADRALTMAHRALLGALQSLPKTAAQAPIVVFTLLPPPDTPRGRYITTDAFKQALELMFPGRPQLEFRFGHLGHGASDYLALLQRITANDAHAAVLFGGVDTLLDAATRAARANESRDAAGEAAAYVVLQPNTPDTTGLELVRHLPQTPAADSDEPELLLARALDRAAAGSDKGLESVTAVIRADDGSHAHESHWQRSLGMRETSAWTVDYPSMLYLGQAIGDLGAATLPIQIGLAFGRWQAARNAASHMLICDLARAREPSVITMGSPDNPPSERPDAS